MAREMLRGDWQWCPVNSLPAHGLQQRTVRVRAKGRTMATEGPRWNPGRRVPW